MSIIAVVVLYKCRPDRSPAIASLALSWDHYANSGLDLKLIIYDNSPEPQPVTVPLPFGHQYVHDAANGGLAAAYNFALGSDPNEHYKWLLLLDQDSDLPDNFMALTAGALSAVDRSGDVAAIVPQAVHKSKPLSPARLQWWGGVRPIQNPAPGICPGPVTAINSGALLRKSFLSEIGGFNPSFKLDYLDHWMFAEINRRGKKIYMSQAAMAHDLSVWDSTAAVPQERYRSILEAETLFYRTSLEKGRFKYHLLNLALRACRQWLSGKQQLRRLTVSHLRQISANR
jgi:GT2 family glycosyltransferase